MKTIHCTQKLLKEITTPVQDLKDIIPDNSGLGNWYGNLFRFNRRKCLIFTSELTLYTFFVYGVKKHDIETLPDLFRENLKMNLKQSGIEHHIIDQITAEYNGISFCKTANRSVLGSMNDFIRLFTYRIEDAEEVTEQEIMRANMETNNTPMSAIKAVFPIYALQELIAERYL